MNEDWRILGEEGLRCFGSVSASISHEIRNAVAIMYENAGLMQDFFAMAEKGKPLNPDRLKQLGEGILQQVHRADGITRNMNAFAHSVDEPAKSVQVEEHLKLAAALFARTAAAEGVEVEVAARDSTATIITNPFFLLSLLWFCLLYAMDRAQASGKIVLSSEKRDQGAAIMIQGLEGTALSGGEAPFPSEREKAFARALDAGLEIRQDAGELLITLPREPASGG